MDTDSPRLSPPSRPTTLDRRSFCRMEAAATALLYFLGTVVVAGVPVVAILWLKRGGRHPDTFGEWSVILALVAFGAAAFTFGIMLEPEQLPAALIQVASAMIAGIFVGVVIIVLDRRQ